jgi:single-strand DNA-binding protein
MADGLNRVMLLGNLGADPELRMTSGGQSVLKMRLATSETYLDRNKVRQERTEWHNVVVWGKRAEALGKFLTKGSKLFVEGGLRTSSYDDKDGNKRYRTEIVANNIILTGSRGGGGGGGGGRERDDYGPPDDAPSGRGGGGGGGGGGGSGGGGGGYDDADYGGGGDDDIPF